MKEIHFTPTAVNTLPQLNGVEANREDLEFAEWLCYVCPEEDYNEAVLEAIRFRTFLMPYVLIDC